MSKTPNGLQMTVPAEAENVAVVRHALAGLAEELGMDEIARADLKTVVTEACMNVVVHAYEGKPGPLMVEAEPTGEGLKVIVRDRGRGIRPEADIEQSSLRLGLSLIAALSSSFAIAGGLGQGTEVSMLLPLEHISTNGNGAETEPQPGPLAATEIVVGDPQLLGPILARTVSVLAARQDLSLDRVSDAVLLTDAVAALAPACFADGHVRLSLDDREDGVDLRLGPMENGLAEGLREKLEVPALGGSLETLADELAIDRAADGDYLVIRFSSPPPG